VLRAEEDDEGSTGKDTEVASVFVANVEEGGREDVKETLLDGGKMLETRLLAE
jgi:hypothetical protein